MSQIQSPGRYPATASSAQLGESNNGTPYIEIAFNTDSGETISGWLYLSERALANSVKTLRDAFEFNGDFETVVEQITGKPCSITVENESYDNPRTKQTEDRLKVKWINAQRTTKPIADQSSFLKGLSAKAARIPKEAPKAPPPTRSAAPLPSRTAKKDVPFA